MSDAGARSWRVGSGGAARGRKIPGWAPALLVASAASCTGSGGSIDRTHRTDAVEVSPEIELDPPDLGPAPGQQDGPGLINMGDHYLAVWYDERETFGVKPPSMYRMMAARLAPTGEVLDPVGFPFGPPFPSGNQVSCNDSGLCLFLSGGSSSQEQLPLLATRVSGEQVLDPVPIQLAAPGARLGSVAWNGDTAFRTLWMTESMGAFTALVGEDGSIGDPILLSIPLASLNAIPMLKCGGASCLLTFQGGGPDGRIDLLGRMIAPDGSVSDEFTIGAGHALSQPFWDGDRYWIVTQNWQDRVPALRAHRIEDDGTILDPAGIVVASDAPSSGVSLGHDGSHVFVAWHSSLGSTGNQIELRRARLTSDGELLDPGGSPLRLPQPPPPLFDMFGGMTCRDASCLVFIRRRLFGSLEDTWIRGIRTEGLTLPDPKGFDISVSPAGQANPAVASGPGGYLAVWEDSRRTSREPGGYRPLRGTLFSPDMDHLVPIEMGPDFDGSFGACPHFEPTVAASASSYLIAWTKGEMGCPAISSNIYGQFLGLDGSSIRPIFDIQNTRRPESRPAAASSGSAFLVVWERMDTGLLRTIRASRFDASGQPLLPEQFVVANGVSPSVAFGGSDYLVAWQAPKSRSDANMDVFAGRVSPDGAVLDSPAIVVADGATNESAHSVACGAGLCLVAWQAGGREVRALRIAPDGTVLDPGGFRVAPIRSRVTSTSVAFDGTGFVVVWQNILGQLLGAEVSPAGAVTGPEVVVASEETPLQNAVVASDGAGHRFVLYDRYDRSPTYNVRRVRLRVLDDSAAP